MVSILATLHITKAKDELGNEIDVQPEFTTGIVVCVLYICSKCGVLTDVLGTPNHFLVASSQGPRRRNN